MTELEELGIAYTSFKQNRMFSKAELCAERVYDVDMVKGRKLMQTAFKALNIETVTLDYDMMCRRNHNLVRPTSMYKDRTRFEEEYTNKGFLHVARRWGNLGLRYKLWQLKNFIRNIGRE